MIVLIKWKGGRRPFMECRREKRKEKKGQSEKLDKKIMHND